MTAADFLDLLASRSLLPEATLTNLKQQVARSTARVTPESLAKLLVSKGMLTAFQAEQLLAGAKQAAAPIAADDDLGLAPLDDERHLKPTPRPAVAKPAAPTTASVKATAATSTVPKTTGARPAAAKPSSPHSTPAIATAQAKAAMPSKGANAAASKPTAKATPARAPADPFGLSPSSGPLDDLLGSPLADDPLLGNSSAANPLLGDMLLGDPLLGSSPLAEAAVAKPGSPRTARRRKKGVPKWVWIASSGAAALVGIVIAIVILTRSNGDAEWQLAEKDFQAGQDQAASEKLTAFLDAFPQHRQVSLARVYLGMTRLRQAFAAKSDYAGQLAAARDVLPKLVAEPAFPQVRESLAKMLPDVAAGLTDEAAAFHGSLAARHEHAEQAREGLALVEDWRFVPDKLKPWPLVQSTSDRLAHLSREIDRGLEVEKATTAIQAAIAAGKPADAFAVRDTLLEKYPELRQGSEFDPVVQELFHRAAGLVKVDSQSRPADTKPRATPIVATLTGVACEWKNPHSETISAGSELKARSIAILADGAVYWFKADNGAPLGRQFVGLESVPPTTISTGGNRDSVVFDAVHKELACYASGGTELRWRQPLGDSLDAPPLFLGGRIYAAMRGGKLAMIEAASGKWLAAAQFPESLRAAPGVSADGKTLYVAGDHGALYFVSATDLACSSAAWLGYGSGSVRLAPVALGQYLVLIENPDWEESRLRVVSLPSADSPPRAVQKINLPGAVRGAPVVRGTQMFLATDTGAVMAYDASGSGTIPLIKSMHTQTPNATGARHDSFLALAGKRLWLAGNGLAHLDLDSAAGSAHFEPDGFGAAQFGQSPLAFGDRMIVAYRRADGAGVWITALDSAGTQFWRATVATPPIGEPVYDADSATLRLTEPLASEPVKLSVGAPLKNQVVVVPLNHESDDQPAAGDRLPPRNFSTPFGKGNLVANLVGQICLIEAPSGRSLAAAFQPRLVPGERLQWRQPAVMRDKTEAILSDGGTHLYRIGIDEKPLPHLTALAEATVGRPVVSDVAVAGVLAYIADDVDNLTAVNVADLKAAKTWPLGGRVAWGPCRVGGLVLVATGTELLAIDKRPDIAWRVPLDCGIPVGVLLASGDELLVATADGFIARLDRKTGKERSKIDLEQPLAAGPIACGKNLAVVSRDGSALVVNAK